MEEIGWGKMIKTTLSGYISLLKLYYDEFYIGVRHQHHHPSLLQDKHKPLNKNNIKKLTER